MPRKSKHSGSDPLNVTAENIGVALGRVAARLDSWKRQRVEIAGDIQKIMRSAQALLGEIGQVAGRQADPLIQPLSSRKGGRPKGYKTSAATKQKLRAAWKRRRAAAERAGDKVTGG